MLWLHAHAWRHRWMRRRPSSCNRWAWTAGTTGTGESRLWGVTAARLHWGRKTPASAAYLLRQQTAA
eukprot:scaffold6577_cov18-Tisochrysis_lutea.AAC.1